MNFESLDYYKTCDVEIKLLSEMIPLTTAQGRIIELNSTCANYMLSKTNLNQNGCWDYNGFIEAGGYGQISVGTNKRRQSVKAHRLSYYIFHQENPGQLNVMHSCDRPCCINPSHLSLGTHQENMRDKELKGRGRHARGKANNKTRFTDEEVVEIIIRYEQLRDYTAVAREFDTTRTAIRGIVLSKTRGLDVGLEFEDLKGDADLSLREIIKPNIVQNTDAICKRQDMSGAKNCNAKLNWDLVNQIREDYKTVKNGAELARRYNVSKVLIGKIINNKIWKTTEPIEQRKLQYTLDELAVIKERYRVVGSLQKVADELDIGRNKLTALLALAV
jgi:hypothetical protein